MLEIRKAAVLLDEQKILTLERIVTDLNEKEAIRFLKKSIYEKIARSQRGRLKSHLDSGNNPVAGFLQGQR